MKVYKPRPVLTEIGHVYAAIRLVGGDRRRDGGQRMTCDACNRPIVGDVFAGGFVQDHANLILHVECVPEGTNWPRGDGPIAAKVQ